jgi:hypothetical protein
MRALKIVLLLFVILFPLTSAAQDDDVVKPGLIRAHLIFSPSRMSAQKESYFYLHGNIEGYITPLLSISAEGYASLGSTSDRPTFAYNHNGFFGANLHKIHGRSDLYIGLQPGLAFSKLNSSTDLPTPSRGVNPVVSIVTGYNAYIGSIFHLFLQLRLITGQHVYDVKKDLTELRLSAGLGFNVTVKK